MPKRVGARPFGKPRVKCGVCPNQAFVAVTDAVIRAGVRDLGRVRSPKEEMDKTALWLVKTKRIHLGHLHTGLGFGLVSGLPRGSIWTRHY